MAEGNSRFPDGNDSQKCKGRSRFPDGNDSQKGEGRSRFPDGNDSKKGEGRSKLFALLRMTIRVLGRPLGGLFVSGERFVMRR